MIKKMGRLPLGSVSPYVKTSSGGSIDPMKFYCTSYGEAYGQEGFHPRNGFHFGAGYKSNYRPVVQYNPNLDKIDNPAVGKLLQDNYESTTNKHFQPLQLPDGKYPLPWSVHQPGSGYGREKPLTSPTTKTVKRVHFDTANQGAEAVIGLEPRHVPVLHSGFGKGSVEVENARHVSLRLLHMLLSPPLSEHLYFPPHTDFLQKKTIGAKEESGFTEGCLANPIVEKLASQVLPVVWFLLLFFPRGDEFLPVLSKGSERGSGFSRQKDLRLGSSVSDNSVLTEQVFSPFSFFSALNFCFCTQEKCVQNSSQLFPNYPYVCNSSICYFSLPAFISPFCLSFYIFLSFYETISKGVDREGWTRGGIQPQQAGGFATNNHGTDLGSDPNATETLRTVHPHVGRTITTVDPFYRDSPHDRHFAALHQTTVPN
uniref:Stabilizer of axonemal microtubules 4 n=1 Tax=Pseudonaja textilis TaxID=8673 RepID=A0A670Z5E5_PSETE